MDKADPMMAEKENKAEPVLNELYVSEKEIDSVELRSEEVQAIFTEMPHWTIRWGITYIFVMLLLFLLASWFIKYPDKIVAPITLTTKIPPASVIARTSGNWTLLTEDAKVVQRDDVLGFIQNTSNTAQVLDLMNDLNEFSEDFHKNKNPEHGFKNTPSLQLGELQDPYNAFIRALEEYRLALRQQVYQNQIMALNHQIAHYNTLISQQKNQNELMGREFLLVSDKFKADSILFNDRVISRMDYNEKKIGYIQAERNLKNAVAAITNNKIQISQLEGRVAELKLQEQKENQSYVIALEAAMNNLTRRLRDWEHAFVIKAPISGKVALLKYKTNGEYVKAGDEVLVVIPENSNYLGRAVVPIAGSGKLKEGQPVNIRLDNYPAAEYGMILGKVGSISLLPRDGNYNVEVTLIQGLQTTYNKQLPFMQEMKGQIEIITKDLSLLERFFYKTRELFD